jgi:hypothetical protein
MANFGPRADSASVDFLNGQSPGPFAPIVVAFRQTLLELGYVEGRVSRLSLFRYAL